MSLKVYKNYEKPDWMKFGAGDLMFGLQRLEDVCLPIHNAYYGANISITEFMAVRVDYKGDVIETIELPTGIIYWKDGQYLTKAEDIDLKEGIYYLYFVNQLGDSFRSELFGVQAKEVRGDLNFSSENYTFDSTLQSFDNDIDYKLKIK